MSAFNFIYYSDVDDIRAATGIAWHVCEAAENLGILGRKFGIDRGRFAWPRRVYALGQLLRGEKPTGFQWSPPGARACMRQLLPHHPWDNPILSCQTVVLAPEQVPQGAKYYWYIDATTHQLATHYDLAERSSPKTVARAHDYFKAKIMRAEMTFTRSNWALESLLNDYGIPQDKCCVVYPGCNLPARLLANAEQVSVEEREKLRRDYDFVVNYCGQADWHRKGLDMLLEAWKRFLTQNRGRFLLRIMGPDPVGLPDDLLPPDCVDAGTVEFTGRFDKLRDGETYLRRLAHADLLCLPTRSDASPQVGMESIRMGTPVLSTRVGGIAESIRHGENGLLVDEPLHADKFFDVLQDLFANRERLEALRRGALSTRSWYDWRRAVREIASHMGIDMNNET